MQGMRGLVSTLALFAALAGGASSASQPPISVDEAWSRPVPPALKVGAVYLRIVNSAAKSDRLLSAETPAAATVEFHETRSANGIMQMRQVPYVDCPPGTTQASPGGLHIMLLGLMQPLTPGSSFPLILSFRDAGKISVSVSVEARD